MYYGAEGFMISVAGEQKSNNLNNYVQIFEEPLKLLTLFFPIYIKFNNLSFLRIWHEFCLCNLRD